MRFPAASEPSQVGLIADRFGGQRHRPAYPFEGFLRPFFLKQDQSVQVNAVGMVRIGLQNPAVDGVRLVEPPGLVVFQRQSQGGRVFNHPSAPSPVKYIFTEFPTLTRAWPAILIKG